MNIPNTLTVFRFLLVPVFLAFLLNGLIMQALVTFILAGLTDALDGAIARMTDSMTELGAIMDPLADKALVLTALITLTAMGRLSVWLTLTVLVRDIVVISGSFVIYKRRYKVKVRPVIAGKLATFMLLSIIVLSLLGIYWGREFAFTDYLAWVTAVLVIISGIQYVARGIRIAKENKIPALSGGTIS
jgi:cardiolipin synthase